MVSQASSEVPAPGPSVQIPSLPGLGTTWYERGARYWLRRVLTGILWLAVLTFAFWILLGIYMGFLSGMSPTVRTVWNSVLAAASCVTVVWGWVAQRRRHREALLNPPTPEQTRQAKRDRARRNVGVTFAGRGLVLLAAPVLPALIAYAIGEFLAVLTVRESAAEVGARRWLEKHPSGT